MTTLCKLIRFTFTAVLITSLAMQTRAQIISSEDSQSAYPVQQAVGGSSEADEDVQWVSWPKITMPKVTMPKVKMPDMSKVFSPISSGFKKVSSGTKKAWEGTKEMFSSGKVEPAPVTSQPTKQSFWQKLTTRSKKTDTPQTVGEFMAQPRLNP